MKEGGEMKGGDLGQEAKRSTDLDQKTDTDHVLESADDPETESGLDHGKGEHMTNLIPEEQFPPEGEDHGLVPEIVATSNIQKVTLSTAANKNRAEKAHLSEIFVVSEHDKIKKKTIMIVIMYESKFILSK